MDIHEAVKNGDTEAVKKLIDQGADISSEDKYGFTALMEASERGHLDIVKLLVESGADVNRKNKLGWSSLCYAATRRQVPVVKFLVESGADINTDCQGRSLFKWVLQHPTDSQYDENRLLEIIRYLIDNGAVTDSSDMEFAREVHRDYQTQCPSCKRSISKQNFAPAKTEKKKFWQLWK